MWECMRESVAGLSTPTFPPGTCGRAFTIRNTRSFQPPRLEVNVQTCHARITGTVGSRTHRKDRTIKGSIYNVEQKALIK